MDVTDVSLWHMLFLIGSTRNYPFHVSWPEISCWSTRNEGICFGIVLCFEKVGGLHLPAHEHRSEPSGKFVSFPQKNCDLKASAVACLWSRGTEAKTGCFVSASQHPSNFVNLNQWKGAVHPPMRYTCRLKIFCRQSQGKNGALFWEESSSKRKFLFFLACALGKDKEFFNKCHNLGTEQNTSDIRFLWYPPIPQGENQIHIRPMSLEIIPVSLQRTSFLIAKKSMFATQTGHWNFFFFAGGLPDGQFRCGEHTDFCSMTLLIQDASGGLEVWRDCTCRHFFCGVFSHNKTGLSEPLWTGQEKWRDMDWESSWARNHHGQHRRPHAAMDFRCLQINGMSRHQDMVIFLSWWTLIPCLWLR